MKRGVVKFFDEAKGYGFIIDQQTGAEYFVHASALDTKPVVKGDLVQFEVEETKRGVKAVNVSVL
jgi:CspA family cold shock protein